ncbi:hypothetical protein HYV91_03250 [Candidatus Wolfebacteria bacterium]|nr:hypothetical protein [Candidatus Wolfebacteria bacterium]
MTSLIFVFVIPALIAGYFISERIPLFELIKFIIGITVLGSIYDIWATRHGKRDPVWLWQFNPKDTLGITIFNLPIEEYLFYPVSSVYIVFMWEGIKFASETNNLLIYLLLSFLSAWTMLAMFSLYILRAKRDKLI